MAFENLGLSFSPLHALGETARARHGAVNPTQEAIRTISTRIPQMRGGRSIAPEPLLTAPGKDLGYRPRDPHG